MPAAALVKEGDDVKLVCEADGNPAPVFSFYKKVVRHLGGGLGLGSLSPPLAGSSWPARPSFRGARVGLRAARCPARSRRSGRT